MYKVHFAGLIYFHVCTTESRQALVPDGTEAVGHIPSHYASIFIELAQHDSDNWWPTSKIARQVSLRRGPVSFQAVDVLEFRIPERAEISFACGDTALDTSNLDVVLPQLKKIDDQFVIDLDDIDVIATLPLPGGKLEALGFGSTAMVTWTITQHSDPITITARVGDVARRITLKGSEDTSEIVFSNTQDFFINNGSHEVGRPDPGAGSHAKDGQHHFTLYAKINKKRDSSKLENFEFVKPKTLPTLSFRQAYLGFLEGFAEIPAPNCVPTCC